MGIIQSQSTGNHNEFSEDEKIKISKIIPQRIQKTYSRQTSINDDNYQSSQGDAASKYQQNGSRYKSHRSNNKNSIQNSSQIQTAQYVKLKAYDLEPRLQNKRDSLSIYKSQELKLPKIDTKQEVINNIQDYKNSILPKENMKLIPKPLKYRNEPIRNSSQNIKLPSQQQNVKQIRRIQNENSENVYASNTTLPQIQTIDKPPMHSNKQSKINLRDIDVNFSVERKQDAMKSLSSQRENNYSNVGSIIDSSIEHKNKYKNKNFHQIMKDVHINKSRDIQSDDLQGWNQNNSQQHSKMLVNQHESSKYLQNIKNNRHSKDEGKSQQNIQQQQYQPTIVTTTKASIQIETTSKVINNNNSNSHTSTNQNQQKYSNHKSQNDDKLPSINPSKQNTINSKQARQQFNHNFNQSNDQVNEQWKQTENSIQEEIFENQNTYNNMKFEDDDKNGRKYTQKFEYGSPKIQYRESMNNKYNNGLIGMTTDNFERLSLDLNDLLSDHEEMTRKDFFGKDIDHQNTMNSNTYNQFDNILGQQILQRDVFTPPFMRTRTKNVSQNIIQDNNQKQ
eukprot:403349729